MCPYIIQDTLGKRHCFQYLFTIFILLGNDIMRLTIGNLNQKSKLWTTFTVFKSVIVMIVKYPLKIVHKIIKRKRTSRINLWVYNIFNKFCCRSVINIFVQLLWVLTIIIVLYFWLRICFFRSIDIAWLFLFGKQLVNKKMLYAHITNNKVRFFGFYDITD